MRALITITHCPPWEGLNFARVSAFTDLQGVMSRFDWHLDRFVPFDRPGTLTVDHDIERAAHDARRVQMRFLCHFQSRRHFNSPFR